MHVSVIGTGYVGLVTGACFAETGNDVVCVDLDESKVAMLRDGRIPIFEPGLEALVKKNLEAGRISFTTETQKAVESAEVVFIAVGTPPLPDGGADLSAVDAVAKSVRDFATKELVIVDKSTVPVGTAARVRAVVEDAKVPVHVVSNPEFLKEGAAVNDFLYPERIVVGVSPGDTFARDVMSRLYHPFNLSQNRMVWMDPASAELTKYTANTMLAMRISFMNEIAMLCEKVGADIHAVRRGVGSDARIGSKFLHAGPGYGGSCFPKDVKALMRTGRENGLELELASTTDRVNDRHKLQLGRKTRELLGGNARGKRIAVWGIAFKPRTDDIRESPALSLIDGLLAEGAEVTAHDPEGAERAKEIYGDRVRFVDNAYDALEDADALVLVTEWREYQNPDFERISKALRSPNVVDGRNIWAPYSIERWGLRYASMGAISGMDADSAE